MIARYPAHMRTYSSNNNKRWTKEDEVQLMELIDNNRFSIRKAADTLHRSYCAAKEKRQQLLAKD